MREKRSMGFKYVNFALSFGLTLVIVTYLLFKGGMWLDQKLGTEPFFMAVGVGLAIITVFRRLVKDIKTFDEE
ncbi:MAG: AtpZ/AtpI family protein [Clostridia bacterium]|nr:AtpZ/AtpI family protein [Clostridia bacterium]MDD4048253.1 AtpZ/AtpI family protein [Clostridia bacterium]